MNNKSKMELIKFIEAVEQLTAACLMTIGMETASAILSQCHHTKEALDHDETIIETR